MNESPGSWMGRLEAEIARELGQPVTVVAGGEAPEAATSLCDLLQVPGAHLILAVDAEGLAAVLVEGRLIEAGHADPEVVRELWTGILASVAGRLGGTTGPARECRGEPCGLHLGSASVRMALAVEETGMAGTAPGRGADATPAEPGKGVVQGNYALLLDVELAAVVRFGSREMELKELLELGPGDVVELDRHVADPVDLIVGDKIIAHGEVVLVNGNFGLRITEVAEPVRRLESIRCLS